MLKQKQHDKGLSWLEALKQTGSESFEKTGLPTPAQEDWKFTSLRAYERVGFEMTNQQPDISRDDLPEKKSAQRIVFVNGVYRMDLSDRVDGFDVVNLSAYLDINPNAIRETLVDIGDLADMPLKADNTAHIHDGFVLVLAAGKTVRDPIEILYFSTDKVAGLKPKYYVRNVMVIEEGASITLVEHFAGNGVYAGNHVSDISLGKNARLEHHRLQQDSAEAFHFYNLRLMQHDYSLYNSVTLTTGARLSRHEVKSLLIGRKVSCNINGLYMLAGVQHYDAKILADHMEPDGVSRQLFKGILDDKTRAVYQGKVHVRRAAQGTDGRQLSHALLLSDGAEINAKPELEIYADDVECAHGATSGALDEEPLFYMQSRGISEDQARRLLMSSFLSDVVECIDDDGLRGVFQKEIDNYLFQGQGEK